METPYRKVVKDKNGNPQVTNELLWVMADDEEKYNITHANVAIDPRLYN